MKLASRRPLHIRIGELTAAEVEEIRLEALQLEEQERLERLRRDALLLQELSASQLSVAGSRVGTARTVSDPFWPPRQPELQDVSLQILETKPPQRPLHQSTN